MTERERERMREERETERDIEREKERERAIDEDRQTDRQTDREQIYCKSRATRQLKSMKTWLEITISFNEMKCYQKVPIILVLYHNAENQYFYLSYKRGIVSFCRITDLRTK